MPTSSPDGAASNTAASNSTASNTTAPGNRRDTDADDLISVTAGVRERSTRIYYRADDAVITGFFAANTSKSEALCNLIYLYSVDYGVDTDVSQLVRENMVRLADGGEVK